MLDLSHDEAREFIAEVTEDNHGITAEDREFLLANRPSALRALQKPRRQLVDSIKTVVDNLYSKETRFLYELIQNAEDNSYSTATAAGELPFVAFKLYPDKIIVDSNEDGFSKSDIRAICSVGASTKKFSAGYIGEKGIGFKSVFKVASKVHIQSGPCSFAFSHTREDDDDGLGMITPYFEDAEELPSSVRTRITLYLVGSTRFEDRAAEFQDIPDTLLIFLTRLQRLSIEIHHPSNDSTVTTYLKRESEQDGLYTTILEKTTGKDSSPSTSEQKYYTTKTTLKNLPFDEARKDNQGNSIDAATVILAFPVDENDEPVIMQQHTFAFLPLRRVGFTFLIQSDFITQANREDVVHSQRNKAILNGVAEAFVNAVVAFCSHPSLKYQWMRYLPTNKVTDEFWGAVSTLVRDKLLSTPLLESWSGKGLCLPAKLQKVTPEFLAEDGNPLLPDIEGAEIYLSPKYAETDFQTLKSLGTTTLSMSKLIDRLEVDLKKLFGSKWRSMDEDADWRSRLCKLLSGGLNNGIPSDQIRLKKLPLVPLHNENWVTCTQKDSVYFPFTDRCRIPSGLGLKLASETAFNNFAWQGLLSDLGVTRCPPNNVTGLIYERYRVSQIDKVLVKDVVRDMWYLFWFVPDSRMSLSLLLPFINQHNAFVRTDEFLYFPDKKDEFCPFNLFKQDGETPGHPVHFLNEMYTKLHDPQFIRNGRSWKMWLKDVAKIRMFPEICNGDNRLSKDFRYIIDRRSDRLLGVLSRGWVHYRPQINDAIRQELQNTAVLTESGRRTPLQNTFLPSSELKTIASELGIAKEYPFIATLEMPRDEKMTNWPFIRDLRIGSEENLAFYLSALEVFQRANTAGSLQATLKERVVKIYQNIGSRCGEDTVRLRDVFKNPVILASKSNSEEISWLSSADCRWNGPQWLKSKQCLKPAFDDLSLLFTVVLNIPDASQADIIQDLLMIKKQSEGLKHLEGQSTISSALPAGSAPIAFAPFVEEEPTKITTQTHFWSTGFMDVYKDLSYEELRLQDYDCGRKTLFSQPIISSTMPLGNAHIFAPFTETDYTTVDTVTRFHSIGFMDAYKDLSYEELRLQDYSCGRKTFFSKIEPQISRPLTETESAVVVEELEMRYQYLSQTFSSVTSSERATHQKTLCSSFETSALVYAPKQDAWFPPSKCIWVESGVQIPGKASIADAYPRQETFFTDILKISKPTVDMYVASLVAGQNGKMSLKQIKETMALICKLGIGSSDLSNLAHAKILPVRLTNGKCELTVASASFWEKGLDFAILENTDHRTAFNDQLIALDFSLEEIRDTRQLLLAMGLEGSFSSKIVRESTDVTGGFQDHAMTRDLQLKSQAIVRCCFHFASPSKRLDVRSLYRKFENARVFLSDGIRTSLRILQSGASIEGISSRANIHVAEEGESAALTFYLPKDEVQRDVCLESSLPRRICEFLDITDARAPEVIGAIFRKNNAIVIEKIIEMAGVSQVDCDFASFDKQIDLPETDVSEHEASVAGLSEGDISEDHADIEEVVETTSSLKPFSPNSPQSSGLLTQPVTLSKTRTTLAITGDVRRQNLPSPLHQISPEANQDVAYRKVLEDVVKLGRKRALSDNFQPPEASAGLVVEDKGLSSETIREAFAGRSLEQDFRIQAAGELHMFTYLKELGLPEFGLSNWCSEIRDRVKIHRDYHDIEPTNDRSAIADIEYRDVKGYFTKSLIKKGYLSQWMWDGQKPLYHIEVETTTSSNWQEPFFMSGIQEKQVRDRSLGFGKSNSSIYMICRIFNLGKGDDTGLLMYLDPEMQRRTGQLEMSAHTWTWKPLQPPIKPLNSFVSPAVASKPTSSLNTASPAAAFGATSNAPSQTGLFGSFSATSNAHSSATSNDHPSTQSSVAKGTTLSSTGLFGAKSDKRPTSLFSTNSDASSSMAVPDTKGNPPSTGLFGLNPIATPSTGLFGSKPDTAPSTGLFGSNPTAAPSTALFGSKPDTTATTGLFGSKSDAVPLTGLFGSNPAAPTSTGLFGSQMDATPSTTSSAGLFGSKPDAIPSTGVFGSKPAATTSTATTSTGLFGSEADATPSTGLFGSKMDATPSTGLFDSKPAATTSASTTSTTSTGSTGLFASKPATTTSTTSTGLFGPNPATTTSTTTSTGLFGSKPATTTAPTTSTGFFGSKPDATPSTRLFGSKPATTPSTGLFGLKPAAATSTTSAGLFGSNPATTTSTTATSSAGLFGSKPDAAPSSIRTTTTSAGLFGSKPAATPSTGLFGSKPDATTLSKGPVGSNLATTSSTGLFSSKPDTTLSTGLFNSKMDVTPSTELFGSKSDVTPSTEPFGTTSNASPSTGLFGAKPDASSKELPGAKPDAPSSAAFGVPSTVGTSAPPPKASSSTGASGVPSALGNNGAQPNASSSTGASSVLSASRSNSAQPKAPSSTGLFRFSDSSGSSSAQPEASSSTGASGVPSAFGSIGAQPNAPSSTGASSVPSAFENLRAQLNIPSSTGTSNFSSAFGSIGAQPTTPSSTAAFGVPSTVGTSAPPPNTPSSTWASAYSKGSGSFGAQLSSTGASGALGGFGSIGAQPNAPSSSGLSSARSDAQPSGALFGSSGSKSNGTSSTRGLEGSRTDINVPLSTGPFGTKTDALTPKAASEAKSDGSASNKAFSDCPSS